MGKSLSIFFVFYSAMLFAQTSTLSIMGKSSYVDYAEGYSLKLKFEEDPSKCDPVVGFVSIEDQIKHYTESLEAAHIAMRFKEDEGIVVSEFPTKKYTLILEDEEKMIEAIRLAKEQRVIVDKMYYLFPEHEFVDEDRKAILALHDAKFKAELYAGHIGKKLGRILYIDDETTAMSNPYEESSERYAMYNELLEKLAGYSTGYKTEHYAASRSGAYGLWVEFELLDL